MNQGIIFDLEDVLLTIIPNEEKINRMIYDFLKDRKYLFHPDDLNGKSPLAFANSLSCWRGHDREILDQELGKLERQSMMEAKSDPSASGVLSVLSRRYRLVILSTSRGDGIVKALGNAGIRQFFDYIVPGERWAADCLPRAVGLKLAMAKYPEIPLEKWRYVGALASQASAKESGLPFYAFGTPPVEELEDLLDIL